MRSVHRSDFSSKREFQYAHTKQELQVRDLGRYGIMPVLLQSFAEYTDTLKRLERRHKNRQVFISGSANSYGPWSETDGQKFLADLGRRLSKAGMNVITGFGLGVGPHVINGVLDELEKEGTRNISDRLTLRPFPYAIADPQERRARWATYREDMISKAGIALFVFGNKVDPKGNVVPADGMLEEFKIAQANGLLVVPVGSTGYVAKTIYETISGDIQKHFPNVRGLKTALTTLGKPGTPHQTLDRIMHFLTLLTRARVS